MGNIDNLEYGVEYDLTTNNGKVYEGWYLYDLECGYFSRVDGDQTHGFMYSESISSISRSTPIK